MAAVVLIGVISLAIAILLAVLLPGVGLIGSAVVAALGIGVIGWMVLAGGTGRTPSDLAHETDTPELLGPGGPDDPGR